jgi:hypothetical protein
MTAKQASFPLVGSFYDFKQYGESRAWISDLFPHIGKIADDICIIKSMNTDAINHDPALTFFQTGAQQGNRPSMGSWVSYGLGSENKNLPAFTVLLSKGKGNGQGVYSKLWSNGFLDSIHQGVQFSSGEDPILYLNDPEGLNRHERRKMLDNLAALNDILQRIWRPGDKHQDTAVRNGLPHANRRARDYGRARSRMILLKCTAPIAWYQVLTPPIVCWRENYPRTGCALCSFTTRDGTSTTTCRRKWPGRPRMLTRHRQHW